MVNQPQPFERVLTQHGQERRWRDQLGAQAYRTKPGGPSKDTRCRMR